MSGDLITTCEDTPELKRLLDQTKATLFWQKGAGFLGPLLCNISFHWSRDIRRPASTTRTSSGTRTSS